MKPVLRILAVACGLWANCVSAQAFGSLAIPEPDTIWLVGTGLAALVYFSTRKKK